MSSGQQMPPWLQEQITKMQQSQQNLQSILAQKQQVEMENTESDRALEELQKAKDDAHVFKYAGSILIKSDKNSVFSSLEFSTIKSMFCFFSFLICSFVTSTSP